MWKKSCRQNTIFYVIILLSKEMKEKIFLLDEKKKIIDNSIKKML